MVVVGVDIAELLALEDVLLETLVDRYRENKTLQKTTL